MYFNIGLGFLLDGTEYSNNSMVALDDIGQTGSGSVGALYCLTNNPSCCSDSEGLSAGEWFIPGQTNPVVEVGSSNAGSADFTRARGASAVLLNRRNGVSGPSGAYTCEIPDAAGQMRTLFIGVGTTGTVHVTCM